MRKETIDREDRVHMIRSIHRLCELRRAKKAKRLIERPGARIGICECCGEEFEKTCNAHKCCAECRVEMDKEYDRDYREKRKAEKEMKRGKVQR